MKQWQVEETSIQSDIDWTKFIFVIIGLLFYILLLNVIGYFATTFIMLLYLFKINDMIGWALPVITAAASSVIFYLLFNYYLDIPLP